MLAILLGFWMLGAQEPARSSASDSLAAAKTLYIAADYEGALEVLSTIDARGSVDEADQYRALCLLALGRRNEVEGLLQSLIVRNPSFRMSEEDVSPRLVSLFQETRRRLLPGILKDLYSAARDSFEHERYADAASRFKSLSKLLADEPAAADNGATVAADLQVLTEGFLKLAERALDAQAEEARRVDANAAAPGPDTALATPIEAVRADSTSQVIASSTVRAPADDVAAIDEVVRKYAQAYAALDAAAAARLLQHADPRQLQAAFGALKAQHVEATDVAIAMDASGQSAVVTLTWAVEAVPKVGSPRKTQTPARLRVEKSATGEWTIVERR